MLDLVGVWRLVASYVLLEDTGEQLSSLVPSRALMGYSSPAVG